MASKSDAPTKASTTIPSLCRIPLLYFEPLFALAGAILVYVDPLIYVSQLTRNNVRTLDASANFIYTELAGAWLHFAFTEAVVLRFVDDVRVWRLLCMGMLLSDIPYCHSVAQAVGGWGEWLIVSHWTREDWIAAVTTWPFVLSRVAIVLGIGFKGSESGKRS